MIKEFLAQKQKQGLLRFLRHADYKKSGDIFIEGKKYIDFSSNDYLGLSQHAKLIQAAQDAAEKFGTSSSSSRLLSGSFKLHNELEEKTAEFKKKEAALVFNSGYQANIGIISALCTKQDAIFCDKMSHASIIDGTLLSGSKFFRFSHNDLGHLESLLEKYRNKFNNALIITESIFSMDGDKAPLKGIVALKEKYNCRMLVDEAHATGIFGKNGSGLTEEEGLSEKIEFIMGTFSKAMGSFGAYLACSKDIKDYLINTCRSFIYSTALPAPVIAADIAAIDVIKKEPHRRKTLLDNADYFRNTLKKNQISVKGASQIIPLITGDCVKTLEISKMLMEAGYWALPIRPPTVPKNESRIRFSLAYNHAKKDLKRLLDDIIKIRCSYPGMGDR